MTALVRLGSRLTRRNLPPTALDSHTEPETRLRSVACDASVCCDGGNILPRLRKGSRRRGATVVMAGRSPPMNVTNARARYPSTHFDMTLFGTPRPCTAGSRDET